ncbi:hypothetical protein [Leifsonia sp. A12D58]|uniref:hypothetical protein n=1 Tax=Leifsonia sp. A12D58 TaxID=3397674 RepID=UPI0039E157D0
MINDLDRWLAASPPQVTVRSPDLTHAMDELVTERAPRKRRSPRLVTACLVAVALLGGGLSLAAAAPSLLAWFGHTDNETSYSNGQDWCKEGFRVVDTSNPKSETASLIAAREYLMGLDIESVDVRAYLELTQGAPNPESLARALAIQDAMIQQMENVQLPSAGLTIESAGECGGAER